MLVLPVPQREHLQSEPAVYLVAIGTCRTPANTVIMRIV